MKEGLIPVLLGTAVSVTGYGLKRKAVAPMISSGIVGFGLAHVVLGTIDLLTDKD